MERTTIRWSSAQLATIRKAATAYRMPYQNYVKDAAFRRALDDLKALSINPR
jgi:predicted DNA binding CopG/RHH family protein